MSLTNKQTAFVREYVRDFNATRAALAVGYKARSAASIGSENLQKPEIKEAIREAIEMSADEVKARLADIARGDIASLMDITPTSYSLCLMVKNDAGELVVNPKTKLIKKIKQKVTTIMGKSESAEDREIVETEIELYSAHDALRDIGKIHALFTEKSDVSGDVNLNVIYTNSDTPGGGDGL